MKRKLKLLSLIACIVFTTNTDAQSPSLETIISKFAQTMGGLDAFEKIKTAKISGKAVVQNNSLPINIYIVNKKSSRMEISINGQSIINVYHEGNAWKINPLANAPTPSDATPVELVNFKTQAYLANHLMDYASRGHKVELVGTEMVDKKNAYKIKLINADNQKPTLFFIDAENYALLRTSSFNELAQQDMITEYANPKNINGILVFTKMTSSIAGNIFQTVEFETIDLNTTIDASLFIRP